MSLNSDELVMAYKRWERYFDGLAETAPDGPPPANVFVLLGMRLSQADPEWAARWLYAFEYVYDGLPSQAEHAATIIQALQPPGWGTHAPKE